MRFRAGRCVALAVPGAVALCFAACITTTEQSLAAEYYNLGNIFFELEQYDRAVENYGRALMIDNDFSRVEYNLVFSYVALERYDDARALLGELLAIDPDSLLLLESDAYVDYVSGQSEQAQQKYAQVLEIDPQRLGALYNLALIHYTDERYEEAEALFERAVRIADNDSAVLYYYALTKHALNRDAVEINQLARDILIHMLDDAEKLLRLGAILEELRYFSDAIAVYQQIADDVDQYSNALFAIGRISLFAIDQPQEGLAQIDMALALGFRDDHSLVELYDNEYLLQRRQLMELFDRYEIDVAAARTRVEQAAADNAAPQTDDKTDADQAPPSNATDQTAPPPTDGADR